MALGIYEEEDIRAIAKIIRNNLGNDTKYTTEQMPDAIDNIQTYAYNSGHSEGKTEAYAEVEPINAQLENTLYGEDIDVAGTVVDALGQNVNQANSDFVAIKGKIVEKGVSVADGTRTAEYADKVDEVYEAGRKSQYDEVWDSVINDNTMRNVQNLFAGFGWNDKTFYPPKDIIVISGRGDGMFARSIITNIKQRLIDCGVKLDLSRCSNLYQSFLYSTTRELPEISTLNNTTFQQTFSACSKLETIDKLILKSDGSQTWISTFYQSPAIKNIVIEGVIGQNGFNVQWCPLTHESLMSIINALKDNSGTDTWNAITLGPDNIAKLTQEELDIMEQKHWEYT